MPANIRVFDETAKFLGELFSTFFDDFQQISTYRKRCTTDILNFAADDGFLAIIALYVCFHTFHATCYHSHFDSFLQRNRGSSDRLFIILYKISIVGNNLIGNLVYFPLTWHRQHLIHIRTEADLIKL